MRPKIATAGLLFFGIPGLILFVAINGCSQSPTKPAGKANADELLTDESSPAERIASLLAPRRAHADVMRFMMPRRAVELGKTLSHAFQKHPELLLAAKPGERVPYDEKMGLSKGEYEEYHRLSQLSEFRKVDQFTVVIEKKEGSVYTIRFDPDDAEIGTLEVDASNLKVVTPHGEVAEPTQIKAKPEQTATGLWNGLSWKTDAGASLLSGKRIRFNLGRFTKSKKILINYDIRDVFEGKDLVDITLYVDLPTQSR